VRDEAALTPKSSDRSARNSPNYSASPPSGLFGAFPADSEDFFGRKSVVDRTLEFQMQARDAREIAPRSRRPDASSRTSCMREILRAALEFTPS